nr:hypothetical protein CFP56_28900 [Quercus suber]
MFMVMVLSLVLGTLEARLRDEQPPLTEAPPTLTVVEPNRYTHRSIETLVVVLAVITIVGVIAGIIARLCGGRHGENDIEGWIERRQPPLHTPFHAKSAFVIASTRCPPHATLSSRCDCATKMASAVGSPPLPPLQDNVDVERHLREVEDRLREAIEELLICLIIGFSSQDSR